MWIGSRSTFIYPDRVYGEVVRSVDMTTSTVEHADAIKARHLFVQIDCINYLLFSSR
jgi:hypothetical protein